MSPNKQALAAKRAELEGQRDALRARITEIEDKIRALNLIMEDRQFLAYVLSTSPEPSPVAVGGNGMFAGMGLRAAIRDVLSRSQQPLKPIEVTEQLVNGGYPVPGHRLKLRVSQEMHRMMRNQKLRRSQTGRYRLAESDTVGEAK